MLTEGLGGIRVTPSPVARDSGEMLFEGTGLARNKAAGMLGSPTRGEWTQLGNSLQPWLCLELWESSARLEGMRAQRSAGT